MKYELTIIELGKVLKSIEDQYKLNILIKSSLSGGWMTIIGEAEVVSAPKDVANGCAAKFNNIITLRVKDAENEGALIKLTGSKDKKFNVVVDSAKYKEISNGGLSLNAVKTDDKNCTLKIDEDMVFSIKAPKEEVEKLLP